MIITHLFLKLCKRINSGYTKTTGCIKKLYSYTHKNRERKIFTGLQIAVITEDAVIVSASHLQYEHRRPVELLCDRSIVLIHGEHRCLVVLINHGNHHGRVVLPLPV